MYRCGRGLFRMDPPIRIRGGNFLTSRHGNLDFTVIFAGLAFGDGACSNRFQVASNEGAREADGDTFREGGRGVLNSFNYNFII